MPVQQEAVFIDLQTTQTPMMATATGRWWPGMKGDSKWLMRTMTWKPTRRSSQPSFTQRSMITWKTLLCWWVINTHTHTAVKPSFSNLLSIYFYSHFLLFFILFIGNYGRYWQEWRWLDRLRWIHWWVLKKKSCKHHNFGLLVANQDREKLRIFKIIRNNKNCNLSQDPW